MGFLVTTLFVHKMHNHNSSNYRVQKIGETLSDCMSIDNPIDLSQDDEPVSMVREGSTRSRNVSEPDIGDAKYPLSDSTGKKSKGHKDPNKGKRARGWIFTWNNPRDPEDREALLAHSKFKYIKFQYEYGGRERTPHYQGILWYEESILCSRLKHHFPKASFRICNNIAGSIKYCGKKKDGKGGERIAGPWEKGEIPAQGRRTDILSAKESIDEGKSLRELFDLHPEVCIKYTHGIKTAHELRSFARERTWQTYCYVYWGNAGTGKSLACETEAAEWGGGIYRLAIEGGSGGKIWWDDYEGQENIIIDEWMCGMKLSDLKKLIDRYPYRLAKKGGHVNMLAKRIFINCQEPPHMWYPRAASLPVHRVALNRRLHYVENMDDNFCGVASVEEYIEFRKMFVRSIREGLYPHLG